jgi:hypothetical protein
LQHAACRSGGSAALPLTPCAVRIRIANLQGCRRDLVELQ